MGRAVSSENSLVIANIQAYPVVDPLSSPPATSSASCVLYSPARALSDPLNTFGRTRVPMGVRKILHKPINGEALIHAVQEVLSVS
jgi:hypothetical protein